MEDAVEKYDAQINGDFSRLALDRLKAEYSAARGKLADPVRKWNQSGQNETAFFNFCRELPYVYLFYVFKVKVGLNDGRLHVPGWFRKDMPPEFYVGGGANRAAVGAAGEAGGRAGAAADASPSVDEEGASWLESAPHPQAASATRPRASLGGALRKRARSRAASPDGRTGDDAAVSERLINCISQLRPPRPPRPDKEQQQLINNRLRIQNLKARARCSPVASRASWVDAHRALSAERAPCPARAARAARPAVRCAEARRS